MVEAAFVAGLGLALAGLYAWAFTHLPAERYQVLATVPWKRRRNGLWRGGNLTAYGLFSASGSTLAAAIFLVLAASLGASREAALALLALVMGAGLVASRWIARWVEKKPYGFTVGGAVFAALLAVPPSLALVEGLFGGERLPRAGLLAAMLVAYAFGESLGRLACISFGCCYGKPVSALGAGLVQRLAGRAFRFEGATKKIAFASGLEGVPVVPIQAWTAVVLALVGLASLGLFFVGRFFLAAGVAAAGSQLWRVLSETLRADYRGEGRLSAYQWMALATIPGALALFWLFPDPLPRVPVLARGLAELWHPLPILALQALWLTSFVYTGWSRVTGSTVALRVYRSRI